MAEGRSSSVPLRAAAGVAQPKIQSDATPADASSSTPTSRLSSLDSKPPLVPDHELIRRIGRGSYGDVWLARNIVGTTRAVKVVYRSTFDRDRPYEREFAGIQKFEPVSRSHEGFVDILQIGRNDQSAYFYYVMELADEAQPGPVAVENQAMAPLASLASLPYHPKTLKSEIALRGPLPFDECVAIGLASSCALAHLHEHGLVHRDIKPSNIIFVDGAPKLADIGLVTGLDATRSFVGTDGYIPPEGPGTPQADLYSLGKVLYEMSTGQDRQDFPELPAEWRMSEERERLLEFNELILKACEGDVHERYQSAQQLESDLALLQRGQSVKRQRAAVRRGAFARTAGAVAGVIALLLAVGGFLTTRHSQQKEIRRQEAHKLFLAGKAHANRLTREEFSKAVELYHQAIAVDPVYAPPYVGLAETYVAVSGWHLRPKEAMSQARWAARRALELDATAVGGHVWLGKIKQCYDWDWAGAEMEFKRAIEVAPRDEIGHSSYSALLAWLGRFDEAEAELACAHQLGRPSGHRAGYDVGILLFWQRKYEQAIAEGLKTLVFDTNSVLTHFLLMDCYVKTERFQEALGEGKILRALDDAPYIVSELAYTYAVMGDTNQARQLLTELEGLAHQRYVSRYFIGFVHLGLGEHELAMDCLEEAYEERFICLGSLKVDPFWDAVRGQPRFMALLKKLGLEN